MAHAEMIQNIWYVTASDTDNRFICSSILKIFDMTLSTLINHHPFETVIPFIPQKELEALNMDLFHLRETYDLLRTYSPTHPLDYPIYAGLFTQNKRHWESGLRFMTTRLTFEDVGRQICYMQGGSLIPAELVAKCLIEYLSQSRAEQIYNAEQEPLVIPTTTYDPFPQPTHFKTSTGDLLVDMEPEPTNPSIKTYQTPRDIRVGRARIRKARTQLCSQWRDLLTPEKRTAVMLMTQGKQLTYRDLSQDEEPLTYIIQSIQRYSTFNPYCFDTVFCRVARPQALQIEPALQQALHEALRQWLGHDNLQINQTVTEEPHIRCQILFIETQSKSMNFDKYQHANTFTKPESSNFVEKAFHGSI